MDEQEDGMEKLTEEQFIKLIEPLKEPLIQLAIKKGLNMDQLLELKWAELVELIQDLN